MPKSKIKEELVHFSVSMPKGLRDMIDAYRSHIGATRSGYITHILRAELACKKGAK